MTDLAAEQVAVGAYVFEKAPPEATYSPRCGVVVDYGLDGEGEPVVVVLRERANNGKLTVSAATLRVADLDPAATSPPVTSKLHQAARALCRAIADRRGRWEDHDDLLLVSAHRLVHPEAADG